MAKINNFNKLVANAAIWSSITQITSKIITPLTNMILARLLAPDAFGVIATVTMIVTFVEMFTDSGFQKYLVQKEFQDKEERNKNATVAFWSNFTLAIILWSIIIIFNESIATLVGNPGLGIVIIVACAQLPLSAFSSIQMALYHREFDFKTLFVVRTIGVCIPIVITIPLALLGFDYWSLIIGLISMQLFNAVFLTIKSSWKPNLFFDFKLLKNMYSFSVWSLIEAISIWLTTWVDTFVIVYFFNEYYLGLYKTSTIMVASLMSLVTAAVVPVLFSTLSRLQNDEIKYLKAFLKFQKIVAILVFPLGVGVYLYSDLATDIMLGDKWNEASDIIALWGITSAIMIVFGYFSSEVYRSKGRPKLSFFAQVLHLSALVPTIIIAAPYGFWILIYARAIVRFQFIMVHLIFMKIYMKFSIIEMMKNLFPSMFATSVMFGTGLLLQLFSTSYYWQFISIILCGIMYFSMIFLFKTERNEIINIGKKVIPSKYLVKE